MKRLALRIIFWLLGPALCLSLGWGVYQYSTARAEHDVPPTQPTRLAVVETVEVGTKDLEERIEFIGRLQAKAEYTIRARTGGYVTEIPFDMADVVRPECDKLPLIVALDDSVSRIQLKGAKAALKEAQAMLRVSQGDLRVAERQYQRVLTLGREGRVTKSQVEESEAAEISAKGQVELHEAQIARADASVEQAELRLAETRIIAPSAGIVAQRHVEVGDYLEPGDPLVRIVDISTVICVIRAVEKDYQRLAVGQHVDVRIDAFSGQVFAGRVARKSPTLDEMGTAEVHVEIDNPAFQLKPGMHGRVSVVIGRHRHATVVPVDSIVQSPQHTSLFVVTGQPTRAESRRVKVGIADGESVRILSGVSTGERVVTTGSHVIKDGERVETEVAHSTQ